MTDRELLEAAAKAAGLVNPMPAIGCGIVHAGGFYWNPLTDDGDALRLAVKVGVTFTVGDLYVVASWHNKNNDSGGSVVEEVGDDKVAATRRAIVRAAFEFAKRM